MDFNEQIDLEDMVASCQICGHVKGHIFARGRNMYGLPAGTVLCGICLGQHKKWMRDKGLWTGDSENTEPQEIHAVGIAKHQETLFS